MKLKDFIKMLKKHDPNSEVMIQWGYANRPADAITTLKVRLDKRYNHPVVAGNKGEDTVTFISFGNGVFKHGRSLYEDYVKDESF